MKKKKQYLETKKEYVYFAYNKNNKVSESDNIYSWYSLGFCEIKIFTVFVKFTRKSRINILKFLISKK